MNSSTMTNTQSSNIPFDILIIVVLIFTILPGMVFLIIIAMDKTCHTVFIMLISNTCLGQLLCASDTLGMIIYALQNDLQQRQYEDSLCVFRGYLIYVSYSIIDYSFVLQATYRYVRVMYPTRLFYQSARFQLILICATWIFSFLYPVAFLFNSLITYNIDNQICLLSFHFPFSIIIESLCTYTIPVSMVVLIYRKLVRHVKVISDRVTTTNTFVRAQRELKMVQRIIVIITVLLIMGIPYMSFIIISFFTDPPKYYFRLAYIFGNVGNLLIMVMLFQFTDPLKASVKKRLKIRANMVITRMT